MKSFLSAVVIKELFFRVCNLLKNQKIALGGEMDVQELYVAPTVLVDVKPEDDVMNEEIFGPILPILNVIDAREAVKFINSREKPLALYVFTKDRKVQEYFLENTSSGGVCINDTIMHLTVAALPFGGVGSSGMGSYHGKKTFDIFVHKKSAMIRSFNHIGEKSQEVRYPPYSTKATSILRLATTTLNRSFNLKSYLRYGLAFGLGVGITVGGFYIKKNFYED